MAYRQHEWNMLHTHPVRSAKCSQGQKGARKGNVVSAAGGWEFDDIRLAILPGPWMTSLCFQCPPISFHFLPCISLLFRLSFSSPRSLYLIPFTLSLCPISLRGSESGRQIQSLPGKSRRQWTNGGGACMGNCEIGERRETRKEMFFNPCFSVSVVRLFVILPWIRGNCISRIHISSPASTACLTWSKHNVHWSMDSQRLQKPSWPKFPSC